MAEFVAKLDDQTTEPAKTAAGGMDEFAAAAGNASDKLHEVDKSAAKAAAGSAKVENATKKAAASSAAAAAQLRGIALAQDKAAARAQAQAKAFNPEAFKREALAREQLKRAQEKALASAGLGPERESKALTKSNALLDSAAGKARLLSFAIGAVAGASGALSLAQIAIGYQGMFRLQAITQRATLNFRMLFRGVDSKPLEKAYIKVLDIFNGASATGRGLSGLFTRTFNSIFRTIDKAEPYITAFAQGFVLAGLYAENAWLRARIRLLPLTNAIGQAADKLDMVKVVAYGTAIAVGLIAANGTGLLSIGGYALTAARGLTVLSARAAASGVTMIVRLAPGIATAGTAALGAAAPFVALAAAIGAVIAVGYQLKKLSDEWDWGVIKRSIGIGESDADRLNRQFEADIAASRAKRTAAGKAPLSRDVGTLPGASAAQGTQTGAALGDGLVAGMKLKEAAVAAGGAALAKAADAGVRAAADIHSPSKLFRKRAQQMGEGEELGLRDSAKGVQKAAGESLVPAMPGARGAQGGGAAGPRGGTLAGAVFHIGSIVVGGGRRDEVREDFAAAMTELLGEVQIIYGGAPAGGG